MELAWNTQKNQLNDVKGKEMEQERKGKILNEEIDLDRTKNNYDLVESDKNLYQRVKERVDDLKEKGSRVQKNSVVMYSNILTVSEQQAEIWGEQKTDDYFKACHDFFCHEFGQENVVSAKVHKDETAPHMHLHFVPVNKENGKLQARVSMNKVKINHIHNELPKFLQQRDFDVVRGSGKTKDKNIENIHEYKEVRSKVTEKEKEMENLKSQRDLLEKNIQERKSELLALNKKIPDEVNIPAKRQYKQVEVKSKEKNILGIPKKEMKKKPTGNVIISEKDFKDLMISLEKSKDVKENVNAWLNTELPKRNKMFVKEIEFFHGKLEDKNEEIKQLKQENKDLKIENSTLKTHIGDLKRDIRLVYESTKDFLKERSEGFKAFKIDFKRFVDKVKDKTMNFQNKRNVPLERNEFEKVHAKELKKERDRGMEL